MTNRREMRARTDSNRRRYINQMIKNGEHLIAYKTRGSPGDDPYGDTHILTTRKNRMEGKPDLYVVTRMDFATMNRRSLDEKPYHRKKPAEEAYDRWGF